MNGPATQSRARRARVVLSIAAVLCFGAGPAAASAENAAQADEQRTSRTATLRIVDVRAGFAGRFKVGCWTPFEIELAGGGESVTGRVELIVPDGDGVPSRVHAPPAGELTIAPGERTTVSMYAKIGQLAGQMTVGFRTNSGSVARETFSTQAQGPLSGVLPSSETLIVAAGAAVSADDQPPAAIRGATLARLSDFNRLPADWWGYEGVSALILSTDDEMISSQLATPSPQSRALDLWVRMGGKLILSVGQQAEKVLASGAPLLELAPGKLEAVVPLRQSTVLETYVDTNEPLSGEAPFLLRVPQLSDVRGSVEAFAGTNQRDLPLVVRTPRGFGEVVFVAFDLDRAPLVNWSARPRLLEKLLGISREESATDESGMLGAVTTLGFVDLSGQLRGALDQFAGVRLAPFWLVAVLVTAYIVCIGPLDYYLVKRVLRRTEATWLTFAVTVILFSAGAVALAYGFKGRQLRVNQVAVVDFDAETNLVRGTSWSYVYSPANDAYDLSLQLEGASDDSGGVLLSWFGLPGNGFGGMDVAPRGVGALGTASRSLPLFVEPYDFSGRLDGLEHVPIAVWSSKPFVARWWRQAAGGIEAQLVDDGKLTGTLTSRLETPLTDAVLIYGKWAYPIRELAPGDLVDFNAIDPQTADTYLRHVTAQGDRQVAPPYDRASFDVPRIIEIMTAHDLAGGEKYTGLVNEYQGFSEISDLVQNGRAVLLGRCARPAARLKLDGQPPAEDRGQSWTFYRYVFPVAGRPIE